MPPVESPLPRWATQLPGTAVVTVGGNRIRCRITGAGDPVLLLHGVGRSLEDWNEQHDLLSERHRVISLDLPGFAFSELHDRPATLAALSGILPLLLEEVGVSGPVHLVGNSLGGAIAMTFAVRFPERTATLVLASSAGFGREVTLALRLLAVAPNGLRLLRGTRLGSRRVTRSLFYDARFVTRERVDRALAFARQPGHADTLLEVIRELGTVRGVDDGWRLRLLEALRPLGIPTLVVWGELDRVLPATHLMSAAALLPGAKTHLFTATGHLPMIERADEFAALAGELFEENPTG
jgi:pimeloyl-ACP methyl ester carboxylesterase